MRSGTISRTIGHGVRAQSDMPKIWAIFWRLGVLAFGAHEKVQATHVYILATAVAIASVTDRNEQADTRVIADGIRCDARLACQLTNLHGRSPVTHPADASDRRRLVQERVKLAPLEASSPTSAGSGFVLAAMVPAGSSQTGDCNITSRSLPPEWAAALRSELPGSRQELAK